MLFGLEMLIVCMAQVSMLSSWMQLADLGSSSAKMVDVSSENKFQLVTYDSMECV